MLTFLLGLLIGILVTGISLLYLFYCKFVVTNKGLRNVLEIFNSYDKEYWDYENDEDGISENFEKFWKEK